ncbi:MAG: hypothetical protein MUP63_03440 [Candidatus Nanohaloarchaeota archaeon QJJ-7]|nr:hypothetical protein [Candidatus Nanohaloarchaeota archaeon QJJ-7]
MTGSIDTSPSYSMSKRLYYILHALDEMRGRYEYDPETSQEDGKGGAVVLVDGPPEILKDSVSHRIASTAWDDRDYSLRVDDHELPGYLRENFENKDGAPILSDDGFTDTNYYFDIIHESMMEGEYELEDVLEHATEEEWGGRHRSALSLSLHPDVESVVLSSTDGSIRYFWGDDHYKEFPVDEEIPRPAGCSGLPVTRDSVPSVVEREVATEEALEEFEGIEEVGKGKDVEIISD